ncbi:MAG: SDR family oxidoreductase [Clostridia bacterium]|nr:SDR family oxidoreductase [Clostridia bacterium]
MKIKKVIKKVFSYITNGMTTVKVDVFQKTPSEMFSSKRILVTGGGRGLGFYIAKKCISEGAEVIITGRKEETLKAAVKELGIKAKYKIFDMENVENIESTLEECIEEFGKIDCIVNNAGISLHENEIVNVTIDGFNSQINTNLRGPYFLAQAYIKYCEKNKIDNGNIIFMSSERGAQCDQIPYGLTKISINSLTEGLSRKYYTKGIRVNAVAPGITASEMTGISRDGDLYCNYNASKRYFIPEEVAEVVAFLISDYSKCISGEVIYTDAGNHLNPWFK